MPGCSNASEIAKSLASESLDNAELVEMESLDNPVHRPRPVPKFLFEGDFHSLSQSPCSSATQPDAESSHSMVQDLPTVNSIRVKDRLRNQELGGCRNYEGGTACSAEPEDIRTQAAAGQNSYEYASDNAFQRQPIAAKSSLHLADGQIRTGASTVVRKSRIRLENPVTIEISRRSLLPTPQEQINSIQDRRTSTTKTASKRKRSNDESLDETISIALEPLISLERKKHGRLEFHFPEDHINKEQIRDSLMRFGLNSHVNVLRCFAFTIGGCESIVVLKDILQAYRSSGYEYLSESTQKIPNVRRLEIIRSLSRDEAYLSLLRKCHIHQLFIENTGAFRNASDRFLVSTIENTASRAKGSFGNPLNVAEAEITKAMMKEIYPSVSLNSSDYNARYREITRLRRLGRRLDILVSIFGLGILGLLPLSKGDSITKLASSITDNLYVSHFPQIRSVS